MADCHVGTTVAHLFVYIRLWVCKDFVTRMHDTNSITKSARYAIVAHAVATRSLISYLMPSTIDAVRSCAGKYASLEPLEIICRLRIQKHLQESNCNLGYVYTETSTEKIWLPRHHAQVLFSVAIESSFGHDKSWLLYLVASVDNLTWTP